MYPTQSFIDDFVLIDPAHVVAVIVVCVMGAMIVIVTFDALSRRRHLRLAARIAAEVSAREAEQEAAFARQVFLSMVSHEVKTPASTIIGVIDVLRSRLGGGASGDDDAAELLDMASDSAGQILSLVRAPARRAARPAASPS